MEVFSPPRLTGYLSRFPDGVLTPGFALDLTTNDPADGRPWDFDSKEKRDKARRLVQEQRPLFLVGSPVCAPWCTWQFLNDIKYDRGDMARRERARALVHLQFMVELYREQLDNGRYFLHEHPEWATSWTLPLMKDLLDDPRVARTRAD